MEYLINPERDLSLTLNTIQQSPTNCDEFVLKGEVIEWLNTNCSNWSYNGIKQVGPFDEAASLEFSCSEDIIAFKLTWS